MTRFNVNLDQWEISLLFRRSYGPISGMIAWWGSSVRGYSHVDAEIGGILIGARDDKITPPGQTVAIPAGIQERPWNYEPFKYADRVVMPAQRWQHDMWVKFQLAGVGLKYDEDAIYGMIFGRRWHSKGHWICSARQLAGLQYIALTQPIPSVPPQQVTPDQLFLIAASVRGARVESVPGQSK